jgi:mRNA interferase MazF
MTQEPAPPPIVAPKIKSAPKVRQIYWCDFWDKAISPEFWKRRPVVIFSYRNSLRGHVLVLPITTVKHDGQAWAHPLRFQWNEPRLDRWVICNHIYTASTARLLPIQQGAIPRMAEDEFNEIIARVYAELPALPAPAAAAATEEPAAAAAAEEIEKAGA